MSTYKKPTDYFDEELAEFLADKIIPVYPQFNKDAFILSIQNSIQNKALKQRVDLIADELHRHLPDDYPEATQILVRILGPENPNETGMFTEFYWVMPIARFVEKYGLNHYKISINAIEEITRRNTGEYAIRPFIQKHPNETLQVMKRWAQSDNFHLRRLASEGLRPKLPWASKLELFIDDPNPVFEILELLKEEPVHFVKKSVANHITDYLKVNTEATFELINEWQKSPNKHTRWIIKHATRKLVLSTLN